MQALPNLFLIGPMGTGKSTIGRLLAAELRREFHDSDHEIERRCGCDIPWIFDVEGEAGFRRREACMIDQLSSLDEIVLATGGGAVTNAESRQYLRERGTVIYLATTLEQQLRRTARDRNRPLLQGADRRARLEELMSEREPLYLSTADLVIATDRRSPHAVVRDIRRRVRRLGNPLEQDA